MAELRLRAATRADNAFFREIEFQTTWTSIEPEDRERLGRARVQEALDATLEVLLARPGNRILIAENEAGARVGILWLGVSRNLVSGEDEAWIYNVSVLPEFQGQGVGRRLMDRAEELAREEGFSVLGLMVASHNTPALRLYEKQGFRPTNLVMRKFLDDS